MTAITAKEYLKNPPPPQTVQFMDHKGDRFFSVKDTLDSPLGGCRACAFRLDKKGCEKACDVAFCVTDDFHWEKIASAPPVFDPAHGRDTSKGNRVYRARMDALPVAAPKMILPSDPAERKGLPICTGVLDYFPLAIAEVARVSKAGNEQHHPGQPLHWDKTKSLDHADCIPRHLIDRGTRDTDGERHSAKLCWRALALLETELKDEAARAG